MKEDLSVAYIEAHIVCYKTTQGVVTLSHICGLTVEKVTHAVIKTKHCVGLRLKR